MKTVVDLFYPILFVLVLGLLFSSCDGDVGRNAPATGSIEVKETNIPSDNSNRQAWQKPQLVLNLLGKLEDKVIADIGAGTGYFAFRLVNNAKKVIAIDIDNDMIQLMNSLAASLPESSAKKFETRLASPNNPNLKTAEVDDILIVNTIAYISDRVSYLSNLKKSLKPGGKVNIIDYKIKRLPIEAPSYDERVHIHIIEEQLDSAGFKTIVTDDTSLDYQYIIQASVD